MMVERESKEKRVAKGLSGYKNGCDYSKLEGQKICDGDSYSDSVGVSVGKFE